MKQVNYSATNTYESLNKLTNTTKNVWIVLHGIGYLSRYFIRYFESLPSQENYIIAPQAPSKYYQNNNYKRVGASWLTKENTPIEIENVLNYLDAVLQNENINSTYNLIVLGFSQGVSIASRWVAKRKIRCSKLILYAGALPKELTVEDFTHLHENKTDVISLVGDKDEYISATKLKEETAKMQSVFMGKVNQIIFDGKHEIKVEILNTLID